MIIKYLSIALIAFALTSCTKEAQQPVPLASAQTGITSYPIAGTWQQTKLTTYLLEPNGTRLYDTTYNQASFTANDFAVFKNDGTCAVGIDHYYYLNEPNMSTPTPFSPLISKFTFTQAGSNFVMIPNPDVQGPGGGSLTDTISMPDHNTVLIHSVTFGIGPNALISDSYYTNKSQQN
jgi:hypothetical protein